MIDPTKAPSEISPPAKVGDANIAPTTTAAADLVTAGQRRINIIWEVTQAVVALSVTLTTLWVAANLTISGQGNAGAFLLLSNAFFLVVGAYFSRTNHQRTGGVKTGDEGR